MVTWLLVLQLAMWQRVEPPVLHQGSWQSCDHAERVLEHRKAGRLLWELHLGPDDEFALYKGEGPDGEDHTHDGPDNLLGPSYHVLDFSTYRADRTWTVPALHLQVNVVRAGGSRDECMSWWVRVETK
jgi:hypothetical protein